MQYSTPVMKFRYSENKSVCASWNISSGLVSDSGMTSGPRSATAKVLAARRGRRRRLLDEPGQDVGEAGGGRGVNLEEQRWIEQFEFEDGRRPVVQGDEVDPGVGGGAQPGLGRGECGPGRRQLGRRGFERADLLELPQTRTRSDVALQERALSDSVAELSGQEDEPPLALGIHGILVGLDHDVPAAVEQMADVLLGFPVFARPVAGGLEASARDGRLDHDVAGGDRK